MAHTVTAAVILIGDEILSGRTQDSNLKTIAEFLNPLGVEVREARVIPDVHEVIVRTVDVLRSRHDYVFTTGGIGPTHDDITADAVAKANATSYGLSASVWTDDLRRAHRVAAAIDVGTVWVNTWLLRDLRVPFGGTRASGVGREGGTEALRFFTESRTVVVAL